METMPNESVRPNPTTSLSVLIISTGIVEVGNPNPEDFVGDVFKVLRSDKIKDVPDPKWLSWQEQIKNYSEYMKQFVE